MVDVIPEERHKEDFEMDAMTMLNNRWCDDCTGDVRECIKNNVCKGQKIRRIDQLKETPELLAGWLIGITTTSEGVRIVSHVDGKRFSTIQEAQSHVLTWLLTPGDLQSDDI